MLEEPEGRLWPVGPASTTRAEPGAVTGDPIARSRGQRLDVPGQVTSRSTAAGPCRELPAGSTSHAVMAEGFTRHDRAPQQA